MILFKKKQIEKITVEEIHNAFYTEVDKLLKEANISVVAEVDDKVITKANRLKKLGFNNSVEVANGTIQQESLWASNHENMQKEILKDAITYFSNKYPIHKFITEESVKNICKKYGLIYGDVSRYLGNVPDKNLNHIENFKIDDDDVLCLHGDKRFMNNVFRFVSKKYKKEYYERYAQLSPEARYHHTETVIDAPLEIAAPLKDFDTNGMRVENFRLLKNQQSVPDPIVLQPVLYSDKKYYLIVTAWGDEASDPDIANPSNN